MKAALVQLSVTDDPAQNLPVTLDFIRDAASKGAQLIATPECTNLISSDRAHQNAALHHEHHDPTLEALCNEAERLGVYILIGSLCLKSGDDARFANRSFLIGRKGNIKARYDKIHMFDVDVSETERYRESEAYRPGREAVLGATKYAQLGLSVCYDLRFPHLYRTLAQAGAQVLTIPAAFNDTTGAAHWEVLVRARAIENTCFVLAPAQCGTHAAHGGRPRRTWGHSLAVDPWGKVLADGGTEPGVTLVDLDLDQVDAVRARLRSLFHDRSFDGP
ncbi:MULTISPECIES: carbon-nitrogen hydrolase family protein [Thioclava]|uniref:carbon-nitrogen hydrolase family protein n=1 Tax=Thioclava TaxID=285107 RepID=UPI000C625377|nr:MULTISPECIES: carbon-nitrogen hydrolase family protein [Thioclava]MAQ36364.1 amidohydrolase [Thioclava sp.]|tara:strand:- start:2459 stop:3286 length:828 start_codon:yes stop_codon:yes gene_type:complete